MNHLLLLLCFVGIVQPCCATAPVLKSEERHAYTASKIEWEHRYGDKAGRWYASHSAVLSRGVDIVVAVLSNDLGAASPVNHLSLATFSPAGDLISDVAVPKPRHDVDGQPVRSAVSENIFIGVLKSGEILVVGNIVEDRPWVMVVNRDGLVVLSKAIEDARRLIRVTNMIPLGDDHFIVLGDEGLNSLAIKIDASGEAIWEVAHDRGGADFFVDGVATRDGGSLLIENSGQYNLLGMGPSSLIVGHYDESGRRQAEIQVPGRQGSVVEISDGTYVLVYDRNVGTGQDIWIMGLDHSLEETWSRPVLKAERCIRRPAFQATASTDGGVIITGGNAGMPYLAKFDSGGSCRWVFSPESMLPSGMYDVVSTSDAVFVISTVIGPEDSGTRVRVFRIGTGS